MKTRERHNRFLAGSCALVCVLWFSGTAIAVDDGPRTNWKAREGTHVVGFQYLRYDIDSSGSGQFDPSTYVYPNAHTAASVFLASYAHHFTLFKRPSFAALALPGGNASLDANANALPPEFLPPNVPPGSSLSQSSSGFSDPSLQLVANLYGTPALRSGYDQLNYEPNLTVDAAVLLAFPIGEYESDKLVNIGQNRWYGRIALPLKYHFGPFSPGHMTSLELTPSVWLFAENGDFLGSELENDPVWQIEGHLTRDFTTRFFGSIDALYRGGFRSRINGVTVGEDLNIGNLGFTLNYQITDNFVVRTAYSSNVFGDGDLHNSILRIGFVYGWHRSSEDMKKLQSAH